ncbi:hypothetical protein GCM10022255_117180 [Dactylosporangium darangshiense]|uniref:Integral membrane protein n=1 Tax=Dactylosporangium darangshiense TaxID=579108 RepID=A0ABP8DWK4_9ACTN
MGGGGLCVIGVALSTVTIFVSAPAFTFGLFAGFALAVAGGVVIGNALKARQ